MRKFITGALVAAVAAISSQAMAMDYKVGNLTVSDPWARASAGKARNGAAYFTVTNTGDKPDRLISAASKAAAKVELHSVGMKDGVMMMHSVKGIEVAPGEPAVLKPGGLHVMLMGLTEPLKENATLHLTLTFEKSGTLDIMAPIKKAGAMDSGHQQMHHGDTKHSM
ncbi:MAG: copper chaperone PCu(A)C [Rhodospirillales bacterium]|nr:copper chaperone PCu(A)C [Rhodospirillales bacterium]